MKPSRLVAFLALLPLVAPAPALADRAFVRGTEGTALLGRGTHGNYLDEPACGHERPRSGVPRELIRNLPLADGDCVRTGALIRLEEIVFPDASTLYAGRDTQLRLADTGSSDYAAHIELASGTIALARPAEGEPVHRVDTPQATFYFEGRGSYRLDVLPAESRLVASSAESGADGTVLAEVRTPSEARELVRGGIVLVGDDGGIFAQEAQGFRAGAFDGWVEERRVSWEALARIAGADSDLEARLLAELEHHGDWVELEEEGLAAWRPRAEEGWHPFLRGRWINMPDGLTWVSSEPWGHLTSHWGNWQLASGGWVWLPGAAYDPAPVLWAQSQQFVGWWPLPAIADLSEASRSPQPGRSRQWVIVRRSDLLAPDAEAVRWVAARGEPFEVGARAPRTEHDD